MFSNVLSEMLSLRENKWIQQMAGQIKQELSSYQYINLTCTLK